MIDFKVSGFAIVDIEEYESLKRFKENIEGGAVVGFSRYSLSDGYADRFFISQEHALDVVAKMNHDLEKEYNHAKMRFEKIRDAHVAVTKMSIWQFIKWRKKPKVTPDGEVV